VTAAVNPSVALALAEGGASYPAGMAVRDGMDGEVVRRWFRLAADALAQTRSAIDALNVFPVPDSDTGSNLHLTLLSAADAVDALAPLASPAEVWHAATEGAMLGACGNSGIIVSQLLRGLGDVCAPASPCDGPVLARALGNAATLARAAVSRPAEGTVLTVADAAAGAAAQYLAAAVALTGIGGTSAGGDAASSPAPAAGTLAQVVAAAAAGARLALARTQQQLDVLAASGVVDAGAAGLCVLLDALTAAVTGATPAAYEVPQAAGRPPGGMPGAPGRSYGYEVTFLLDAPAELVEGLRERLDALGDSLVIVGGDGHWHVHVHVPDAGAAIEAGLTAGRPRRITVTYLGAMAAASGHRALAIAAGPGLTALLSGAGALVVQHRGGYPPSPAALSAAVRQAGVQVIIVPNGEDGAAAARAAAARLGEEGIEVSVIGVRSPVQALAAMAVHDPQRDFREDAEAMSRAAAAMRYASVSPSGSRPSTAPGEGVAARGEGVAARGEGVVGRVGKDAAAHGADQAEVAIAVADLLLDSEAELVTLVQGELADPGLASVVARHVRRARPAAEVVCYDGGPPDFFLLIGAE
jgi:dihydroxyacetone kinase-like predicted kinase